VRNVIKLWKKGWKIDVFVGKKRSEEESGMIKMRIFKYEIKNR